ATVVVQEAEEELAEDRLQQKPWLQRHLPTGSGTSEDLLLHFMQALEERGVQLYEAQEEAIVEIFSGAHVVLDTPTGSGKSLVAVAALFKALAEGGKAYYTSPTKALTSEKFFDLCRHFGPASVGMATGDISLNQRAPLICCTAEVLASISLHEGQASGITTVVMDEFHYFADPDRGSAWEALRKAVEAANFASPFGAELRALLLKGVGVHHAGLLPRYRRLVEQLSQASLLALVCGTDTLGVGVNVPIRSVLFTSIAGPCILKQFEPISACCGRL
ncbi:helY, partial [Symbiodinium necroappetens]